MRPSIMTTQGESHGPFDLWSRSLAIGDREASYVATACQGYQGAHVTAVRVHQTSEHVDGVQFQFRGDEAFHGTSTSSVPSLRNTWLNLWGE